MNRAGLQNRAVRVDNGREHDSRAAAKTIDCRQRGKLHVSCKEGLDDQQG